MYTFGWVVLFQYSKVDPTGFDNIEKRSQGDLQTTK